MIFDGEFLVVFDSPFEDAQVEFALTRNDSLFQFLRLLDNPSRVFFVHTSEDGIEFFGICFVGGLDSALILRSRIFDEVEYILAIFVVESVAGLHIFHFHCCANVAGTQFIDGGADLTASGIDLSETLFCAFVDVGEVGAGFKSAGHYLEI